jgi:hypothetical protein
MNRKKAKGAKLANKKRFKESAQMVELRRQFYQWCYENGRMPIEPISREELKKLYPGYPPVGEK